MSDVEAVRAWLARTGYPLESEVARAFRATGFEVFQGLHYEADKPDAGGAREIDVLAVRDALVPGPLTRCTVLLVIECKASPTPWVVFRGQSPASALGAVGRFPMKAITELNLFSAIELGTEPWLLGLPEHAGFRVGALPAKQRAPGIDKTREWDQTHAAVKQVVSAVQGVLRDDPPHLPTIAVPVIVLGSGLFTVTDDDDGHQEVLASGWERILWRGDRSGEPIAIDVVAHDFLAEYARLAADGATELLPLLRGAALDARDVEFRRQSSPGRVETAILGLGSAWDAVSKLVGRARRSRPNLKR
jgi:hypothetical protein